MRIVLVRISENRVGREIRRTENLVLQELRVGRGRENELRLPDLTVSREHAVLKEEEGRITLTAIGSAAVARNGVSVSGDVEVVSGDEYQIGTSILKIAESGDDFDLRIEITSVSPDRHAPEKSDSTTSGMLVERGWLNRRFLAWTVAVAALAVGMGWPLLTGDLEFWSPGDLSRSHARLGAEECTVCHLSASGWSGVGAVSDDKCRVCHDSLGEHLSEVSEPSDFSVPRCASCHPDHVTEIPDTLSSDFCTDCHADRHIVEKGDLNGMISDFGTDHSEFRLTFVTKPGDGVKGRSREVWAPDLVERSGLRFNHFSHVGQPQDLPGRENEFLSCETCHLPDSSGRRMQPIQFERHCESCHTLGIGDLSVGERQALHEPPIRVREDLSGLYSELALSGRAGPVRVQGKGASRRPGEPLSEEQATLVHAWVVGKVQRAESHLFVEPGECARCHEQEPKGGDGTVRTIVPVELANVWMPQAEFDHSAHDSILCKSCHAAAAILDVDAVAFPVIEECVRTESIPGSLDLPCELLEDQQRAPSQQASDILIPSIENCRECHSGSEEANKVLSACVRCHSFHNSHSDVSESGFLP